jgi:hypothetical protein
MHDNNENTITKEHSITCIKSSLDHRGD